VGRWRERQKNRQERQTKRQVRLTDRHIKIQTLIELRDKQANREEGGKEQTDRRNKWAKTRDK
jgi:hypothetical protein